VGVGGVIHTHHRGRAHGAQGRRGGREVGKEEGEDGKDEVRRGGVVTFQLPPLPTAQV